MITTTLIVDFDSTLVTREGLDELSKICLANDPKKEEVVRKIEETTRLGMEGKISFTQSLQTRLSLFKPTLSSIKQLVDLLKKSITPSIERNSDFFQQNADRIIIISGGFKEWILPVVETLAIKKENVFANTFNFSAQGECLGCDQNNPLAQSSGKVIQVKSLALPGPVYVLGDGYSDFRIKEAGLADKFFAFTENVKRDSVVEKADHQVTSFDDFLKFLEPLD